MSESAAAALGRFDRYLSAAHRSQATRRVYLAAVERWLRAGGAPGHVDRETIIRHIGFRRGVVAPASVNVDIAAIRCFYRMQCAYDDAPVSVLSQIPSMRTVHPRLRVPPDAEQIGKCIESVVIDGFVALRDVTMIRVLIEAGLRAGECIALETGHILESELFVPGKSRRLDRYVPISSSLSAALACYRTARSALKPGKKAALWLGGDGRPLRGQNAVWRVVNRRLGDIAGSRDLRAGKPWSRPMHPHILRSSYAITLLAAGLPLTAIAQLLGHADVSTTERYLGADYRTLVAAIAHHPRASRAG